MTRRDTIIVATLVNAALLACLFIAATRQEEKAPEPLAEVLEPKVDPLVLDDPLPMNINDEVDLALKEFLPEEPKLAEVVENGIEADLNPELVKEQVKEPEPVLVVAPPVPKLVDVTVKSGDMLEKIAKANGTSVKAIKEANKLTTDKLKVGQVLKIPVATKAAKVITPPATVIASAGDAVYYTIQKGDNPWKIAKKFHVKFEDILKLNSMSEEKAKNLKVGQEIRVK